jgi:hypothetical protein
MAQIEVIAARRQVVGNKLHQVGDRFSVPPAMAELLTRLHRVTVVSVTTEASIASVAEEVVRPRRTYRRRDVVAE